jgi:hypothetical protein
MLPRKLLPAILSLFIFVVGTAFSWAQQIILDNPVQAGELSCFQSIDNPKTYYYIVDKARLAQDKNGRPKFSFMRFARHQKSKQAEAYSLQRSEGGGIVHAVVELGVTKEQIRAAERELKRKVSGARLKGPVIYKKGNFALISAFSEPDGQYTVNVFGIGKAPILDGQKAAISMLLTSDGAELLWKTFNTTTPHITFSFEMELDGYHLPQKGYIEANFDKIYNHHAFSAGGRAYFIGAEVKAAFDDLTRNGHIKVIERGNNKHLEELVQTAYTRLANMIFNTIPAESLNAAKSPALSELRKEQQALIKQALKLVEEKTKYDKIQAKSPTQQHASKRSNRANSKATGTITQIRKKEGTATSDQTKIAKAKDPEKSSSQASTKKSENNTIPGKDNKTVATKSKAPTSDKPHGKEKSEGGDKPPPPSGADKVIPFFEVLQQAKGASPFGLNVAYEYKRVRHSGKMIIDLEKYTTDRIVMQFVENIGDLRRYMGDQSIFRRVVLDDPMNMRREIFVKLGKFDANDFDTFINFVDVKMRKIHRQGESTIDEVRIDRQLFNNEGNRFSLMYGWKHDDMSKPERFLEYEYQTTWNFGGDIQFQAPWTKTNVSTLALEPPYVPREVTVGVINEKMFKKAQVRLIDVRLYTRLGDQSKVTSLTIPAYKGVFEKHVKILMPRDATGFKAEITLKSASGKKLETRTF